MLFAAVPVLMERVRPCPARSVQTLDLKSYRWSHDQTAVIETPKPVPPGA